MAPEHAARIGPRPLRVVDWGRLSYPAALRRQLELVEERRQGLVCDTVVTVQHPPTVTLGRHAPEEDIIWSGAQLTARGIEVVRSDRGGRATYHGPGQAVVYPIVAIGELGLGIKRWVELLEEALLGTLDSYGISGRRVDGRPGIWVGDGKIASVGLRVHRGISYHGVALNVGLDVSGFDCIVTCGVAGQRVTSIAAERAASPSVRDAASRLCTGIADAIDPRSSHRY